ncbi:MAG: F0F1 ATP synthase subunit epsilon, partial [Chitinophagales bacterium]
MQLEILTPEKNLFKGEVSHVELPGTNGSFGVLDNHAPMVSGLDEGEVRFQTALKANSAPLNKAIKKDAGDSNLLILDIKGGFVEVLNNKVSILL